MDDRPIKPPPGMIDDVSLDRCVNGHWFVKGWVSRDGNRMHVNTPGCPVCKLSSETSRADGNGYE